jgi:hypothetical protein
MHAVQGHHADLPHPVQNSVRYLVADNHRILLMLLLHRHGTSTTEVHVTSSSYRRV